MPDQFYSLDVLVVDDEREIVAELINDLERRGLTCTGASDPWEALNLMAAGIRPSVIVVDIRMPEINGLEFATTLTRAIAPNRPEIIFVSGYAALEDAIEAFRLGACDLLTKPIDLRRLVQVIKDILLNERVPGEAARGVRSVYPPRKWSPAPLERFHLDIIGLAIEELSEVHGLLSNHLYMPTVMEPLWNLLVDLYKHAQRGDEVLLESLCRSSRLSENSVLQQTRNLQEALLIEQDEANKDRHRQSYRLTDKGRDAVETVAKSYWAIRSRMH